jgi:hypothetical protein
MRADIQYLVIPIMGVEPDEILESGTFIQHYIYLWFVLQLNQGFSI